MDLESETLIRDMSKSFSMDFRTAAPFSIGTVGFEKIGFAGIKVARVWVCCRSDSLRAITPIVRQLVFRELESFGLGSEILETVPGVMTGKTVMFVDLNESSPTKGKRKRGNEYRFSFDIKPQFFDLFDWDGSRGSLKRKKPA